MDIISAERIALLHPKIRDVVTSILRDCDSASVGMRITQGYRTIEEQDKLYAQSRTMPGENVTNARGGQSWHNYGLAFDCCLLFPNGKASWDMHHPDWDKMVKICKAHEFEWGGNWNHPDYCHFQKRFGLTISQAYKLFEDGNVDKDGYILIRN